MAKPFKTTPILLGKDALRFEQEMQRVNALTPEQRTANREELFRRCENARKKWNLTVEV